jgi:hypothetical protein
LFLWFRSKDRTLAAKSRTRLARRRCALGLASIASEATEFQAEAEEFRKQSEKAISSRNKSASLRVSEPWMEMASASVFKNSFRKLGYIQCNGELEIHDFLSNVVLYDQPVLKRKDASSGQEFSV